MATIQKRGSKWRVQVCKHGIRVGRSFQRKAEALAWAHTTEQQIEDQQYWKTSQTFASIADRYSKEVSPLKRCAQWEVMRLRTLGNSVQFAHCSLADVSANDIADWRDSRLNQVSASSVLRELSLLSAVFEHARREWGLINGNPVRDIRKPPAPKHRERLPTDSEIERICLALGYDENEKAQTPNAQVGVLFLLAVETAMRAGEICDLEWSRVDTEKRVAALETTKNGDSRRVPLSSKALALLDQLRGLDPVRCFTIDNRQRDNYFRSRCRMAGIKDLHFHDSRALALTRMAKKLTMLELARVAGHRDPRSLMIYYRESAEELAKKLD